MSIPAADLRKLVKIVRQYEVIYGGGISSGDAAVREECESIVGVIEAELGGKRAAGGRAVRRSGSLPSLVDAKKKPRSGGMPRPSTARSSEIARLGRPRSEERKAEEKLGTEPARQDARTSSSQAGKAQSTKKAGGKAQVPHKTGVASGKASGRGAAAAKGKTKASPAGTKATIRGRSAAEAKTAGDRGAEPVARVEEEDEVLKDVRSRHVPAARAARERADRIAGSADDAGEEAETKHHFAALHLFDAFKQSRLPKYGGFILSIRFNEETGYTVVEIIGYENLQDIYPEGDTLVFKSVGCKLYAIVEPARYYLKSVEPVNRPSEQMVPYRFSELLRITTKRFQSILVGRKPVFMPTSFSVFKPTGDDIAVLFYDIADVYANIQDFLIMILRDRLNVPIVDSRKAAEVIVRGIHEFRLWMDEA
jgi:hypothetical protein